MATEVAFCFRSRKGKPLQVHHKSALLTCAEIVDAELFTVVFPVFQLPWRGGAVEHQQLTVDRFLQLIEVKFGIVGNDDHIGCDLCSRIVTVGLIDMNDGFIVDSPDIVCIDVWLFEGAVCNAGRFKMEMGCGRRR